MNANPQQGTEAARLSVVVPIYNEEDNVERLVERMHEALGDGDRPWELVLVDDGSRDDTVERALAMRERFGPHVRVVQLQRNFGQTAAMQAGIDHARGKIICTLDGDLQNDPADIPRMVDRLLDENLDLLVGWRRARKDDPLRMFLSRVANRIIGRITGVHLHDYGCSLKIYRASVVRNIRLYGEMHRFIPAWIAGATHPSKIAEEVVQHHPRTRGTSKYGLSRAWRVVLDLFAVYFFMRYRARPGHFFGSIGLFFGLVGGAALVYLTLLKFITGVDIGDRPLLLMGVLFVLIGIQLLTTGVLAEMATRTYYESARVRPYLVRPDGVDEPAPDDAWQEGVDAVTASAAKGGRAEE